MFLSPLPRQNSHLPHLFVTILLHLYYHTATFSAPPSSTLPADSPFHSLLQTRWFIPHQLKLDTGGTNTTYKLIFHQRLTLSSRPAQVSLISQHAKGSNKSLVWVDTHLVFAPDVEPEPSIPVRCYQGCTACAFKHSATALYSEALSSPCCVITRMAHPPVRKEAPPIEIPACCAQHSDLFNHNAKSDVAENRAGGLKLILTAHACIAHLRRLACLPPCLASCLPSHF